MKWNNIHLIVTPEGEEEEEGIENVLEKVMKGKFLNLMREKVTQLQEAAELDAFGLPFLLFMLVLLM